MATNDLFYLKELENGDRVMHSVNLSPSAILTVDNNGDIKSSYELDLTFDNFTSPNVSADNLTTNNLTINNSIFVGTSNDVTPTNLYLTLTVNGSSLGLPLFLLQPSTGACPLPIGESQIGVHPIGECVSSPGTGALPIGQAQVGVHPIGEGTSTPPGENEVGSAQVGTYVIP